jgi:hypothetical protein
MVVIRLQVIILKICPLCCFLQFLVCITASRTIICSTSVAYIALLLNSGQSRMFAAVMLIKLHTTSIEGLIIDLDQAAARKSRRNTKLVGLYHLPMQELLALNGQLVT